MAVASLLLVPVFLVVGLGLPILMGVLVYRDAKARNMDAVLWALVAALVPSFIGLIIYLIVCRNHTALCCAACGQPVEASFASCPHCGAVLKYRCDACGAAVEADWRVCAQCGAALPEGRPGGAASVQPNARGLKLILICAIAIPVLLLLLLLVSYSAYA